MKKFLIRREMEGAGSIPKHDLNNAGKGSEEVLEAMRSEGKNITHHSSVKEYKRCEQLNRKHAVRKRVTSPLT